MAQFLAALLLLPALFTVGQVLWFVCIVVPAISVSLTALPVDSTVMKKPLGKNQIAFSFQVRNLMCDVIFDVCHFFF